jgi:hypothetical protein
MKSAMLITNNAACDDANRFCEELGWGADTFVIPLSNDGKTVTHWAARTDVGEADQSALEACPYITIDLGAVGNPAAHADAVMEVLGLARLDPQGDDLRA